MIIIHLKQCTSTGLYTYACVCKYNYVGYQCEQYRNQKATILAIVLGTVLPFFAIVLISICVAYFCCCNNSRRNVKRQKWKMQLHLVFSLSDQDKFASHFNFFEYDLYTECFTPNLIQQICFYFDGLPVAILLFRGLCYSSFTLKIRTVY